MPACARVTFHRRLNELVEMTSLDISLFSGNSHSPEIDVYAEDGSRTDESDRIFVRKMTAHFLSLLGGVVDYYGADGGENEFKIDGIVFKVLEDPEDGYRSCLGTIEYSAASNGIFFPNPVARVRIEAYEDEPRGEEYSTGTCEGYKLVDVNDGHIWLEFGTDNTNDYYPYFVFRHMPKLQVSGTIC
jgi:hypothetical protein